MNTIRYFTLLYYFWTFNYEIAFYFSFWIDDVKMTWRKLHLIIIAMNEMRQEVFEFDVFWQKVGGHVITIQILYFAKF